MTTQAIIEIVAPVTALQEYVIEVNKHLDQITTSSVEVGSLLSNIYTELKEQGKKQADFVVFCRDNFSIGKAQVFKLMKVAEFFKNDERFKGCAMRVLYSLATEANEAQLAEAAKLAAAKKLDTNALNNILYPVTLEAAKPSKTENLEAALRKQEEAEKSLKAVPEKKEENLNPEETFEPNEFKPSDFDIGDSPCEEVLFGEIEDKIENEIEDKTEAVKAAISAPVQASKPSNSSSDTNLALAEQEGLQNEIEELRKALAEANNLIRALQEDKKAKSIEKNAPMLPQFKSKCFYARLGLSFDESTNAAKIRAAFRNVIKVGYGEGHEAFELLIEAKDALLAALK